MSAARVLVTGASGEMGHELIPALRSRGAHIVALDLNPPAPAVRAAVEEFVELSIVDAAGLGQLFARHRFDRVFHLAAVLSSKAEKDPELAHRVNVEGTWGLMRLCLEQAAKGGTAPRFVFPSSIAVYGLPDAATKARHGAIGEADWLAPAGLYGCHKLYGEFVGSYATRRAGSGLDFRSIRFPGLLSAQTLPSGGTTDYAPEMVHAAAQGRPYTCFVSEESRLPFMTMPDAVAALLGLTDAEVSALSTRVYNIQGFSASAGELRAETLLAFPGARIDFAPRPQAQALVDSWPAALDDSRARADWGLAPRHGLRETVSDYLAPALRQRYPAPADR